MMMIMMMTSFHSKEKTKNRKNNQSSSQPHYCRFTMRLLRVLLLLFLVMLPGLFLSARAAAADDDNDAEMQEAMNMRLLEAAADNDLERVKSLLESSSSSSDMNNIRPTNIDINYRDPRSGQTALMSSVLRGHVDLVDYLLNHAGADPTVPEKDGYLPPDGAGFQGRVDVMQILVQNGNIAGIHAPSIVDGAWPLHRACWGRTERHAATVDYLLGLGQASRYDTPWKGRTCAEMTPNDATLQVLEQYQNKEKHNEEEQAEEL